MAAVSPENEETPDPQLSLNDQGFLLVRPPGLEPGTCGLIAMACPYRRVPWQEMAICQRSDRRLSEVPSRLIPASRAQSRISRDHLVTKGLKDSQRFLNELAIQQLFWAQPVC